MKKLSLLLTLITLLVACDGKKIAIVFDNDVHCNMKGYTRLAWLKDSLIKEGTDVLTVSCGDFLSGGLTGNYSKGFMVVKYMNTVGYDVVTVGNHEFDYTPGRMIRTLELIKCNTVCCNIKNRGEQIFPGYVLLDVGNVKIGFVGVTTPTTLTASTPSFFEDEHGDNIYDFCADSVVPLVQKNTNLARNKGADYVIVLSHLGDMYNPIITSRKLIRMTSGIDAVLDGHEHTEIECDTVHNKNGKPVILSSTGAYFKNIGLLEIDKEKITTRLIPTSSVKGNSKKVDIAAKETDSLIMLLTGNRSLGMTSNNICISVRNCESTLGDFVTDALKTEFGTDIAFINSGSMRTDIKQGEIFYKDIYNACPFGNFSYRAKVKGQEILDMLEKASSISPKPSGGFMQVSGMRYCIDTNICSSVATDERGIFLEVAGERRVHNVEIEGRDGAWQPIVPDSIYSVASIDFILINNGDGIRFSNLLTDETTEYTYLCDILADYIQKTDNGDLGNQYAVPNGRIKYATKCQLKTESTFKRKNQ